MSQAVWEAMGLDDGLLGEGKVRVAGRTGRGGQREGVDGGGGGVGVDFFLLPPILNRDILCRFVLLQSPPHNVWLMF